MYVICTRICMNRIFRYIYINICYACLLKIGSTVQRTHNVIDMGQSMLDEGMLAPQMQTLPKSNGILPSGELTFCNGKSPFLMGTSTISMAIFNCYVSSPEGTTQTRQKNPEDRVYFQVLMLDDRNVTSNEEHFMDRLLRHWSRYQP